jgi:hypothetical protein
MSQQVGDRSELTIACCRDLYSGRNPINQRRGKAVSVNLVALLGQYLKVRLDQFQHSLTETEDVTYCKLPSIGLVQQQRLFNNEPVVVSDCLHYRLTYCRLDHRPQSATLLVAP